jgi:hypothetical protein
MLVLRTVAHNNMLYQNWRLTSEHMNKTWLLLVVASYSAAPDADVFGHPWYIHISNIINIFPIFYIVMMLYVGGRNVHNNCCCTGAQYRTFTVLFYCVNCLSTVYLIILSVVQTV